MFAEVSTCVCWIQHQFTTGLPVPSTALTYGKSSVNICEMREEERKGRRSLGVNCLYGGCSHDKGQERSKCQPTVKDLGR